jgi:5-formyltetrahydrofolate cyclo-ligase
MTADKPSLRTQCLAAREQLPSDYRAQAAHDVAEHFIKTISDAHIVAGYRAVRGELDISSAMEALYARRQLLCLPVVVPNQPLLFRHWRPGQMLKRGRYDIDVPPVSEPLLIPDVVIVPLLAFDKAGHRLGYGAGYYDRTIAWLRKHQKNVTIVGAAYSKQQVEAIPAAEHDEKLDMVVTEKGIEKFT